MLDVQFCTVHCTQQTQRTVLFYVVKDFELNLFLILEVECERLFCKTNLKLKSIKIKNNVQYCA